MPPAVRFAARGRSRWPVRCGRSPTRRRLMFHRGARLDFAVGSFAPAVSSRRSPRAPRSAPSPATARSRCACSSAAAKPRASRRAAAAALVSRSARSPDRSARRPRITAASRIRSENSSLRLFGAAFVGAQRLFGRAMLVPQRGERRSRCRHRPRLNSRAKRAPVSARAARRGRRAHFEIGEARASGPAPVRRSRRSAVRGTRACAARSSNAARRLSNSRRAAASSLRDDR